MYPDGLVFIGKIVKLEIIPGADFIMSATVVCGEGGKWRGVVKKGDFELEKECVVFLPDSLLNEIDHHYLPFMKDSGWRVKMRRFRGAPSEVLIMKTRDVQFSAIGEDVTCQLRVVKYTKEVPLHLQGIAKDVFPDFIPKTDELNYQRYPELVESLVGKSWYMTEKLDGSSTTAYRYRGEFCVCSRNLNLCRDQTNIYWTVASKYKLEENLPDNYAIQWETCGPRIQKNPMGLKEITGFMFSAYKIDEKKYLSFIELKKLSRLLNFPMVRILEQGDSFTSANLETRGEGLYANGNQREGVVIRSQTNYINDSPLSFKVINLSYET